MDRASASEAGNVGSTPAGRIFLTKTRCFVVAYLLEYLRATARPCTVLLSLIVINLLSKFQDIKTPGDHPGILTVFTTNKLEQERDVGFSAPSAAFTDLSVSRQFGNNREERFVVVGQARLCTGTKAVQGGAVIIQADYADIGLT